MDNNPLSGFDYLLRYLITGSYAGKSSIVNRYITGIFRNQKLLTIGVEFEAKNVIINDKVYRIQIWDLCSQGNFKPLVRSYYKGVACYLIVYDITNKETFNNLDSLINDIKKYSHKTAYVVLVGNMADLEDKRQVSFEEGKKFADKYGFDFYETSAKTGQNINEIFLNPAKEIDKRIFQGYYNFDDKECVIKKGLGKEIKKNHDKKIKQKLILENNNKKKLSLNNYLENHLQLDKLFKFLNY